MSEKGQSKGMDRAGIEAIKAAAAVPASCGPDIAPSPARGPYRLWQPVEMRPDPKNATGWRAETVGHLGRDAIWRVTALDLINRAARRARRPEPFGPDHLSVAARYAALAERHSAGGVKCANLLSSGGGGDGGAAFMDTYLAEGRDLTLMQLRIGSGCALAVRRIRPSHRGAGARNISDRALVDAVVIHGLSPSDVLRAASWSVDGKHRRVLVEALRGILDRMSGAAR
ncbi:hypothetical protein [Paracoccus zhouxuedongae]|uniref:hypothetical protein n=1 Tax=Paracoccus sp. p3-h83 TaxID=3342805 RepID=UPI0035BC2742